MRFGQKLLLYLLFLPPAILAAILGKLALRRGRGKEVERVLILQPGNVGDLVLTVPFLRECRKLFPNARTCMAVTSWNVALARTIPYADEILCFDNPFYMDVGHAGGKAPLVQGLKNVAHFVRTLRKRHFDVAFEFRGHANALIPLYLSGATLKFGYSYRGHGILLDGRRPLRFLRTKEYEAERVLKLLDFISPGQRDHRLEFVVGSPERRVARRILEEAGIRASAVRVGFVFGAPWAARRWPVDRFATLADWLTEQKDAAVLLVGSAAERDLGEQLVRTAHTRPVNLAGRVSLEMLGAVLEECDLVVSNDTGPMHVAAALAKPLIALFGPGEAARWGPRGEHHVVIRSPAPCAPCHQRQMDAPCRHPEQACMARIEVAQVAQAVESLWGRALDERSRRLVGCPAPGDESTD